MKYVILEGKNGLGKKAMVDDDDCKMVNQFVWKAGKNNYIYRYEWINRKVTTIYIHRFIMDAPQGLVVDHLDGNPLNNCKSNLRLVKQSKNSRRRVNLNNNNKSGYIGVCYDKNRKKWKATIQPYRTVVNIGRYDTAFEAAYAYDQFAIVFFPKRCRLNIIEWRF